MTAVRVEPIVFEKWHGLGNDFILVRGGDPGAELASALCDRRRGVGADGVLAIAAESGATRMIVRNADGSRPELCGNGLRCVVGAVAAERGLPAGEIAVLTDAGEKRCAFERAGDGLYQVTVAMGGARIDGAIDEHSFTGRSFLRVNVGNPHAVSFEPFGPADIDVIGPALERAVPGGLNVELCRVIDRRRIELSVWERGVGRTMACGTGACAAAAAAVASGLCPAGEAIDALLPGGRLQIRVSEDTLLMSMRGPAQLVFRGEIDGAGVEAL